MDWVSIRNRITACVEKYKYVALVLLLGVVLMLLPAGKTEKEEPVLQKTQMETSKSMDENLAEILSMIDGAGEVEVMLTVASGAETIYQTDSKLTDVSQDHSTVIVTSSERAQEGLVRQVNPVQYLGAIIVCEGAERPAVRLAIVEAVSDVTGLGADRISVLKMK